MLSKELESNETLVSKIKNTLLNCCPYVEDRLGLFNNSNATTFGIFICVFEGKTHVSFTRGNSSFSIAVAEPIEASHIIELEEVEELMDFILEDHESISFNNSNNIEKNNNINFKFDINWSNESSKGINCSTINLNLSFFENNELRKKYLYFLNEKYLDSKYDKCKYDYIDSVKDSYINNLNKSELMNIFDKMSEEELKELLRYVSDDKFMEYTSEEPKIKKYF